MKFYLFPGEIYRRYNRSAKVGNTNFRKSNSSTQPNLTDAYEVYHLAVKQYLGFGGLLQFIPGTNANLARKYLTNKLYNYINTSHKKSPHDRPKSNFYFNFVNIAQFFRILRLATDRLTRQINNNYKSDLFSAAEQLFIQLPLINLINLSRQNTKYITTRKVLNCFNPINILKDLSENLRQFLFGILEIGAPIRDDSSILRVILKSLVAIPFFILDRALNAVELTISAITFPVRQLLEHFAGSFAQAFKYRNNGIVIAIVEDLREAKQLRRAVKREQNNTHTKDTSYTRITRANYSDLPNNPENPGSKYIGTEKQHLYSKNANIENDMPVAIIRRTEAQAKNSRMLVSVVGKFKRTTANAHRNLDAIAEASKNYKTRTL